jgi:hypothetical protein
MDERRAERWGSETEVCTVKRGQHRTHACRNISRLGCMISDSGLCANTGDDIDIELVPGTTVCARVIWARQGLVGLAFKHEIGANVLRQLAAPGEPVAEPALLGRLLPERFLRHAA